MRIPCGVLRPSHLHCLKTVCTRKCPHRRWSCAPQARRSALQELMDEKENDRIQSAPVITKLNYTKPLKIVQYPHPSLRAENARIGFPAEGLKELSRDMFEIMYSDDGVGLAAPQVGVNVRLMVFNPDLEGDRDNQVVLVNPIITKKGGKMEVLEEGCLSFRDVHSGELLLGDVKRPSWIRIKAQDIDGQEMDMKLTGFTARVFQHEYDHLQGVLFFERMAPSVVTAIWPELVALEDRFIKENPGVNIQRIK